MLSRLLMPTVLIALTLIGILPANSQPQPTAAELLRGAEARIDKLRKSDIKILVLDRNGDPVPEARVHVEQTRHEFLFGCAAISLLKHPDPSKETAYQKLFSGLFNFATVLTYWHDTDPEPDRKELALLDEQVGRLQKLGITVKGHPLILAGAFPKWAPGDPDHIRTLTQRHIKDLATRYRGKIDVWDVVGDATTASGAQNGLGAWARKAGPARFTADALEWARAASPKAVLLYNDYKLDEDYLKLIRDVQDLGAPLDALGLEAHMVGSEWPMEKLWETAETFDHLAKPLHFSEITVLSDDPKASHSKAWPSTPEGEARQADYVEKLYTLLFSHPAVKAIAWWNFVDGDWDRMPGGLLRADLTPKPAYERLHQLIQERWRTTADLSTDPFGAVTLRGFAGSYHVTVQTDSGTTAVDEVVKSGQRNNITVRVR